MFATVDCSKVPLHPDSHDPDEHIWEYVEVGRHASWLILAITISGKPLTFQVQDELQRFFQNLGSMENTETQQVQLIRHLPEGGFSAHEVRTLQIAHYLVDESQPGSYQATEEYVFADGEEFRQDIGPLVSGVFPEPSVLYEAKP